jgi:competence protein ComFC
MNNLSKRLFAWLFPAKCIVCKKEGYFICLKHLRDIPASAKPDKDWIISVWSYKDPKIKKLIWMLKFEHKFSVVDDLSQILFDHLFEELTERAIFENNQKPILIPIPLSKKSLRARGYNQSEIIARSLADKSNNRLIVENILEKTRETVTQHSIRNRNERLKNLRGVFVVKENSEIKGKNIILIDDITTTHGTLIEARRTLLASGARSVMAFTIAH